MQYSRQFAMPNSETFSLPPVAALLDKWLADCVEVCDPFSGNSKRANLRNDLNPNTEAEFHMDAIDFLAVLEGSIIDAALLDPPYSPRQIAECYHQIGRSCGTEDTQNARLYRMAKDGLDKILRPGGIAICCGWNSMGFGVTRGYEMLEILLVPHGAAHNETIVTVERKMAMSERNHRGAG